MKTLGTIILGILLITGLGYIAIEWNHNKFIKLCNERPDIPQCPDKPMGGAL